MTHIINYIAQATLFALGIILVLIALVLQAASLLASLGATAMYYAVNAIIALIEGLEE